MSNFKQTYITHGGEMLDEIAYKIYGDETMVYQLYELNPGLVEQPLILPGKVCILLPPKKKTVKNNPIQDIWG